MEDDKRFQKSPCTKCGEMCYHLCYIKTKLVCVDCFGKECMRKEQEMKKVRMV